VADVVDAVRRTLPEADVVVHSVPRASGQENIFDRVRAVATRHNLNVHDVSVQDLGAGLHVEQHLELDETLSLKSAHDRVTALEAEIRQDVPEIASILTHIESEPSTIESGNVQRDAALERQFQDTARNFYPEVLDVHDIRVKRVRDRIYVSCHATMQDNLPLSRVHDLSTEMEALIKQRQPQLFRVLIHTEPQTDNTR
jgi:divalent metal cation (Fe/Co/Zn/Cd) transporter